MSARWGGMKRCRDRLCVSRDAAEAARYAAGPPGALRGPFQGPPARCAVLRGQPQSHRSARPLHPLLAGSSFATPPAPPGVSRRAWVIVPHSPKTPLLPEKVVPHSSPAPLLLMLPRGVKREVPLNTLPVHNILSGKISLTSQAQ